MPVLPKWAGTGIFIYLYYLKLVILNLFQDLKYKGMPKQVTNDRFPV